MAGDEIGEGLDDAEADDERHDQCRRSDPEFMRANQRYDRSFHADHAADAGVDQDEEGELRPVRFEPEGNVSRPRLGWSRSR